MTIRLGLPQQATYRNHPAVALQDGVDRFGLVLDEPQRLAIQFDFHFFGVAAQLVEDSRLQVGDVMAVLDGVVTNFVGCATIALCKNLLYNASFFDTTQPQVESLELDRQSLMVDP